MQAASSAGPARRGDFQMLLLGRRRRSRKSWLGLQEGEGSEGNRCLRGAWATEGEEKAQGTTLPHHWQISFLPSRHPLNPRRSALWRKALWDSPGVPRETCRTKMSLFAVNALGGGVSEPWKDMAGLELKGAEVGIWVPAAAEPREHLGIKTEDPDPSEPPFVDPSVSSPVADSRPGQLCREVKREEEEEEDAVNVTSHGRRKRRLSLEGRETPEQSAAVGQYEASRWREEDDISQPRYSHHGGETWLRPDFQQELDRGETLEESVPHRRSRLRESQERGYGAENECGRRSQLWEGPALVEHSGKGPREPASESEDQEVDEQLLRRKRRRRNRWVGQVCTDKPQRQQSTEAVNGNLSAMHLRPAFCLLDVMEGDLPEPGTPKKRRRKPNWNMEEKTLLYKLVVANKEAALGLVPGSRAAARQAAFFVAAGKRVSALGYYERSGLATRKRWNDTYGNLRKRVRAYRRQGLPFDKAVEKAVRPEEAVIRPLLYRKRVKAAGSGVANRECLPHSALPEDPTDSEDDSTPPTSDGEHSPATKGPLGASSGAGLRLRGSLPAQPHSPAAQEEIAVAWKDERSAGVQRVTEVSGNSCRWEDRGRIGTFSSRLTL
ncbi:SCAN box domain-containing protein [Podarcis lilfordi]|uniref:SCAN box domain-containing protein n=1 Tax=Podarcis lilfordi TaxID=74358 RepID=A0AA35P1V2_9SAUR|nr:SCAN box domain-containing protein [Podarcis lilfordi]